MKTITNVVTGRFDWCRGVNQNVSQFFKIFVNFLSHPPNLQDKVFNFSTHFPSCTHVKR